MILRIATIDDAPAMLEIYAPYIINTSLTFELEVPAVSDFEERIAEYIDRWPWIVCEDNGTIAGYAYASKYRERLGYQWSVECSVYVQNNYMRTGTGTQLYQVLFRILKEQGYRNVYAVINLPNEPSVKFHERCGFSWMATYDKVGFKLGKWKDVGWWRLVLNEFSDNPAPPKKFSDLSKEEIMQLLNT